jgi:hypothetical protein
VQSRREFLKPDNLWIIIVPIVLWVIQLCSFLYLPRVLKWVFSHPIFTAAYQTLFGNRTQGHNNGDASGDAVELQVVSINEVSAPADTTTITIPDRDSVHGLAHPDVPGAIPVTVTADGKAHTGVPMDIPEDGLSDGGSIWDGGVNHNTTVHITKIMNSGGGVSSLVAVQVHDTLNAHGGSYRESFASACETIASERDARPGLRLGLPSPGGDAYVSEVDGEDTAETDSTFALYTILQRSEWANHNGSEPSR